MPAEALGQCYERRVDGTGLAIVSQLGEALDGAQMRIEQVLPDLKLLTQAGEPGRVGSQYLLQRFAARPTAASVGKLQAAAVVGDHQKQVAARPRTRAGKQRLHQARGQCQNAAGLARRRQQTHPGACAAAAVRPRQDDQRSQRQPDCGGQPVARTQDDLRQNHLPLPS